MNFETVEKEAMKLPARQKAILARHLLAAIDEPDGSPEEIEAMWAAEARDRLEAYHRGEMESFPVAEVMARLKKRFSK
jgi:putative addiction module component (TIGR02574 family)